LVPVNVTSACSSFVLRVDAQGTVAELNENNNSIVAIAEVIDSPLPDLTVSNIVIPESVQAGATFTVSFDINNIGDAILETNNLPVAVYANVNGSNVLCPLQSQLEPVEGGTIQLITGESIHFVQTVLVPPTVEPTCNQFTVTVDPNNAIYETNDSNNSNTATTSVMDYPFDLALQSIAFPTEITAGETYSVSWTVQNIGTCPTDDIPMFVNKNGNYYQAQSGNLPYPWVDKVYFSTDESISNDDVCVGTCNRTTVLNPGDSYTITVSFTVPYTVLGNPYLIAATDFTQMTYDMNSANNTASQQVTVLLGDLPDLRITVLDVEPVLTADQTYTISYEVVNEGDGATRQDVWKDAFYLSSMDGILTGAFRLVEKTHQGVLAPGDTYEATVDVTIPSSMSGEFFIIGFTDATSLVYEHDNENNNLFSTPVTVSLPLPCDLIAVDPSYPSTAVSGDDITVSWTLFNTGSNPASGRIRDAVYLSVDNEWSSDDIMLGYIENNINLEANGQLNMELTATVQGITHGSYYLVIRTNILHALNEASYENNTCVCPMPIEVDYPVLTIGSSIDRTMNSNQMIYYKIEVGPEFAHQTLSCQLTTASSYPGNGLYVAFESAPSMSQFDFSVNTPYEQNLEILIPSLEVGDYYLLARGSAQDGQPQNITLSASIINFEILHVNADHGSNTGSLTTQVIGAKFDSIMDFRLVQGEDYMPAEKVFFSNSTESFVTFNLKDLEAGLYDVEAELPGGIITIKDGAFTIEEGLPAELSVNIIAPSSVRSGNTFTVSIEYGNIGTTDLNVSGLVVVSQNGHYVSLESEGLAEHETELYFDTAEPNGNPDVLRPGSRGTRTIFVKANNSNTVRISVFAIRNIY
jgi:subtilase family serine protease